MNIIQKPTPNFAKGRAGYKPEIIVLHISTASAESCISWFANPASQVSSNYLIGLDGQVYQFVKDEDKAWALGRIDKPTSKLVIAKGATSPNLYALSIEYAGKDLSHAPKEQLQASAELIRALCAKWSIPCDREHIIGHREIYSKKTCPSENLGVIDTIISMAKDEMINIPVKKSQMDKVLAFIKTLV